MATELVDVTEISKQALEVLSRHVSVLAAYVFGSHVTGAADEDSDIDLAVFLEGAEDLDLPRAARLDRLVHREVSSAVEVHYFPAKAVRDSEPASFATYVKTSGRPIALSS